jgi:hypothetical protein
VRGERVCGERVNIRMRDLNKIQERVKTSKSDLVHCILMFYSFLNNERVPSCCLACTQIKQCVHGWMQPLVCCSATLDSEGSTWCHAGNGDANITTTQLSTTPQSGGDCLYGEVGNGNDGPDIFSTCWAYDPTTASWRGMMDVVLISLGFQARLEFTAVCISP